MPNPAKFFEGIERCPRAYIGVSCLNEETIDQHVQDLRDLGLTKQTHNGVICAVGFLTTDNTVRQGYTPKKDTFTVTTEGLRYALQKYGGEVFTLVHHFSEPDYDYRKRKGEGSFYEDIDSLFGKIHPHLPDGIQIDNSYVPVEQLEKIKEKYPHLGSRLILQLMEDRLKFKSERELIGYISQYADVVSAVLIDPSGGEGVEINLRNAASTMVRINERFPDLHISIAGGFGPEDINQKLEILLNELKVQEYPDLLFNIDAQKKLRSKTEACPKRGVFDCQKARDYLTQALPIFSKRV